RSRQGRPPRRRRRRRRPRRPQGQQGHDPPQERRLYQLVRAQASRNRELESQLSHYRGPTAGSDAPDPATLLPLLTGHSPTSVDLSDLVPIEDEDMIMSPSAAGPQLNSELSNQIIATLENRSEMAETPSGDEDEEEEDERGRGVMRASRFGRGISASLAKSERVDEVDDALSDGSGKMED
ncbi:hypothetical protein RSAG8_04760, partial [Rhizoctonia solani AG-8 WAC10335]